MNGHSGLSNEIVNKEKSIISTKYYQVCLTFLKESESVKKFVIHARSNRFFGSGYQPNHFLMDMGFTEFKECNKISGGCFYKEIYRLKNDLSSDNPLGGYYTEVDFVHNEFRRFVDSIDELFEAVRNVKGKSVFFKDFDPGIDFDEKEIEVKTPNWITKYFSEEYDDNLKKIIDLKVRNSDENKIVKLLTSGGDDLVKSVKFALEFLGFNIQKTEPGATVDLLGNDENGKIAIEVTGTRGKIEKKSNKISQLLTFLQQDTENHKKLLIANVYNDLDPEERLKQDYLITDDALSLLDGMNSTFIHTYELFKLVRAVENSKIDKEKARKVLWDSDKEFRL